MSNPHSGSHPNETRDGEIERLNIQGEVMSPGTLSMLEKIEVRDGWHCLDIGCGPRGITHE